jgi:hypothetical protein
VSTPALVLLLVPLPPPAVVLDESPVDAAPLVALVLPFVALLVLVLPVPELALVPPVPEVAFELPAESAPPQLNTAALLAKTAALAA